MSLAAGERHQLMMTPNTLSTEVGQRAVSGLPVGVLHVGGHDSFKLLDALNEAGEFGRHARDFALKVEHALCRLARSLCTIGRVPDVGAAPRDAFRQPLYLELVVGVLNRLDADAELLGMPSGSRKFGPGSVRPCGDLGSEVGSDLAGVGPSPRL